MLVVGTAGWSIPGEFGHHFSGEGSHLERYSRVFSGVEINSSFYREHMPRTYERWSREVPDTFRFSVKLSRAFTHDCDLKPPERDLRKSLEGILHLEEKLGVILLQFPGKREFDEKRMRRFLRLIRKSWEGPLVYEARNTSWVGKEARELMEEFHVSKVTADPERCPGGSKRLLTAAGVSYHRLHGSPVIYRSSYSRKFLKELGKNLPAFKKSWVIFDNTTMGAATGNALTLKGEV